MARFSKKPVFEDESSDSDSSDSDDSDLIDPTKPAWWNDSKKKEREAKADARKAELREKTEREKIAAGNVVNYRDMERGGAGAKSMSKAEMAKYDSKEGRGGAGAIAVEGITKAPNEGKVLDADFDYMNGVEDNSIRRREKTADEELGGRSLKDLVDRSTLLVGCCLIMIVVIAVTIPITLISEDEPYVAPQIPDPPTASPTSPRMLDYWPMFDNLARIAGGPDVLNDQETAQFRALNWLVFEDGMELGASSDHLHQRFVLMVVYFISGPWTPVAGRLEWGSPVHECEWEGITCKNVEELEEELNGRVDEILEAGREDGIKIDVPQRVANKLELRQRLVTGEVPKEFSLLYYLQHLDLENNKLTGGLPTPLYKLFNLQTLFIEYNELTNIDAIGEYHHLEHVSVSGNAFVGPLPESFKKLKKLKRLYLHTNAFDGDVFEILKEFKSLEFLDIANNQFSGTIPTELGELKNLTTFVVGNNLFTGSIPTEVGHLTNMTQFQIDLSLDMGGPIPTEIGNMKNLTFLKLDSCGYTGTLPTEIGGLSNLTFIDVTSNLFKSRIPTEYGNLESIETIGLANNDFFGEIPTELGQLTSMKKLYLQNNDFEVEMPDEVCALRTSNVTVIEDIEASDEVCDKDEWEEEFGITCCTFKSRR